MLCIFGLDNFANNDSSKKRLKRDFHIFGAHQLVSKKLNAIVAEVGNGSSMKKVIYGKQYYDLERVSLWGLVSLLTCILLFIERYKTEEQSVSCLFLFSSKGCA